jgi:hypothetical protein
MSAFLTPLWLEDLDGTRWIVCAPFRYQSDLLQGTNPDPASGTVEVPIETETDLGTIPWLLRGLIPRSGKHNEGDVLHDAGLTGKLLNGRGAHVTLIRTLCDSLFLEAILLAGVNRRLAWAMYQAVRIFGRGDPLAPLRGQP